MTETFFPISPVDFLIRTYKISSQKDLIGYR